jgi:hypothetical protein
MIKADREGFDNVSPERLRQHAWAEWASLYRFNCSCAAREVRAERSGLECATCGRLILRRRVP